MDKKNEKLIKKLFGEATFEPDRLINGWYHPYIPLQVYGEPIRLSITEEQYKKFAELIVEECISVVQNRDMGGGDESDIEIRYCISDIKNHFGIE